MNIDHRTPPDEFVRQIDVGQLLPQREPFVMIGSLTHFDATVCSTLTHIDADNLFVEHGCLSAVGLMENIAQTCAARIGYVNKYINKKGIQIGLIGAIRNFEVSSLPRVGTTIATTVTVREELFGMVLADAQVECDNRIIAQTQIKIAIEEEATQ